MSDQHLEKEGDEGERKEGRWMRERMKMEMRMGEKERALTV